VTQRMTILIGTPVEWVAMTFLNTTFKDENRRDL
jgi:hypothetical protein